jgi:alpha-beta hydrolase superfamily lysophospholipase
LVTIRRWRWAVAAAVAAVVAVALGTAGGPAALGQNAAAKAKAARGKGRGVPPRKAPNAADPLAKPVANDAAAAGKPAPAGTYHFKLKVHAFDDAPLAALYYPATKQDANAPAVLLVHEKDRSNQDFEDSIPDLKGVGLAEHLQSVGYAVMALDLRGYGANPRRAMSDRDWRLMVDDLQAAYQFLVDRHNRGELNLAKLGVVALGEGANLAAAWAYQPGGAVSSEGRVTDLSGMALVSPLPEGEGYAFPTLMNALAPRIPVMLIAGERDAASHDVVKRVKANVEKTRQNKVEMVPSSLHGYKLLRLEPRAATSIAKFLEGTVKLRAIDWEPRYNLTPIDYTDIQVVRHKRADDQEKEKAADEAKEKAKDQAKEKAKDQEKANAKDAPKGGGEPPAPKKGAR